MKVAIRYMHPPGNEIAPSKEWGKIKTEQIDSSLGGDTSMIITTSHRSPPFRSLTVKPHFTPRQFQRSGSVLFYMVSILERYLAYVSLKESNGLLYRQRAG
jgi:hypothetical protein